MSSKSYKILCQKCTELKHKKVVKFREKDNGKEKTKDEPQSDIIKQRKRSKTTWRKLSATKQSIARSSTKPGLQMSTRSKRLRAESPCEADDCNSTIQGPTIGVPTPRCGILKRRASSAEAVACYQRFDISPFAVASARIGEEEQGAGKTDTYRVPSLGSFEEKRPKKIRFKIPEGTLGYEDAKKAMWRSEKNGTRKRDMGRFVGIKGVPTRYPTAVRCNSLGSPSESIREIMPVLQRLKKNDDLIESELDLNKIARYIREENAKARKRQKLARESSREEEESEESERESTEEYSEMESDMTDDGVQVEPKHKCRA